MGAPPRRPGGFPGLACLGVVMSTVTSGYFSVPARFHGRVIARVNRQLGTVWATRTPAKGGRPAAPCLFIPCTQRQSAARLAQAAGLLGWRAWVKAGTACAVYQAGPLAALAPPRVAKVELPLGLTASAARSLLGRAYRNLPVH